MRTSSQLWRISWLTALLALAVVFSASAAAAATRYVDPSGSNSGSGTQSSPWKTIEYATTHASPGETIIVNAGTYWPTKTIALNKDNASLVAAPGVIPVIDGSSLPSTEPVIGLWADGILIERFEIKDGPGRGIACGATTGSTIKDCHIHHNARTGIFANYTVSSVITGNNIHHIGANSTPQGSRKGVYLARGCRDLEFSYNKVWNNEESGLHCNGNGGDINRNIVVHANELYGNANKGADLQNTHDSQFTSNLLYGNNTEAGGGGVLTLDSDDNYEDGSLGGATGSIRNVVANNTFVTSNKSAAIRLYDGDRYVGGVGAEDCVLFNNIVITSDASEAITDAGINNRIDHNYAATYGSGVLNNVFVNYQNSDYRLADGSPAEGAGVTSFAGKSAPATDITGSAWIVPYDQGAYEAGGPPPQFQLTTNSQGSGSVSKSPDQATYTAGDNVTLTATPNSGWTFSNWTGDVGGTANPKDVTVSSDMSITAVFTEIPPEVTVTTAVQGNGSVTKSPDQATYTSGSNVTLTAQPDAGWEFSNWSGDIGGTANPRNVTVSSDMSITAVFTEIPPAFTVNTAVQGNGSVTKSPNQATYTSGSSVTLTAVPDAGWEFSNWSGDIGGTANPRNVTVSSDMSITAVFNQLPPAEYTVTTAVQGSGSVTKNPDQATYTSGSSVTLTATPDAGWTFSSWSGDISGGVNPVTTPVTDDMSVTAVFVNIPDPPPAQPQAVAVVEPDAQRVTVSWDANAEGDLAGYVVYYGSTSVEGGGASSYDQSVDVSLLTAHDIASVTGRTYFAVRAYDDAGQFSEYSSEMTLFVVGSTPPSAFDVSYWSFDEGSGPTANDAWANNDATLDRGAGWLSSGAVNGSVELHGVDDRVNLGDMDVPDGPGFSVAMWVKADDFGVADARLIAKAIGQSEQSQYWMLGTAGTTALRFRLKTDGRTTTLDTGTGELQAGQWHHVTATYDGAAMRIYSDGIEVASDAAAGIMDQDAAAPAAIGNQPGAGDNLGFDGAIDDVRLYRRALSPADIAGLVAMRTNAAPVAAFTATPTSGTAPVSVDFDAAASSDPEGDPLTFAWDFGDGATASGVSTNHTFSLAGNYTVVLTVSDDHNNSDTHQTTIVVSEPTFTVTTAVQGNGSVTKSPNQATYTSGSSVTLTAVPDAGWEFSNWTGDLSGSTNPIATTVTGDMNVTAVFNQLPPAEYTVTTAVQGSGSVTKNPDQATYTSGSSVTLTATPDAGWTFSNWSGDISGGVNPITTPVDAHMNVTAVFVNLPDPPPAQPQGVAVVEPDAQKVTVSWDANAEGDLAGYVVYYGSTSVEGGGASSYDQSTDVGLATAEDIFSIVGRNYFAVRAYDDAGQFSEYSSEMTLFAVGSTPPSAFDVSYWSFDEGSGPTANDAWANNDATLDRGAGWLSSGAVNGSVELHGVDDRVNLGDMDVPDGPGFSVAMWVKADDFGVADARLIAKAIGQSEQSQYWMLGTAGTTALRFRLKTDGRTTTLDTGTGELQAGQWHHVTATYDGAAMRIYSDGIEVASDAAAGIMDQDAAAPAAIGNQPGAGDNLGFDGAIDDVRLYRRALSPADIAGLVAMRTNAAPVAAFTATPTSGTAPASVDFDAAASSDPEGDPLTYAWDFGDGATASGVSTNHTFSLAGNYTVVLTVSDDHNNSDTHQTTILVDEQATPPSIPQLQLLTEDSPGCVTVTWLPNGELDLAGYVLYYGTQSVEDGDVTSYAQSLDLGVITSWRECTFEQGRYYFALRAYNDSGLYSGYSVEQDLVVVGPDREGPTVIPVTPTDGATGVALDAQVRFVLVDDRTNVDASSLTVLVDGSTPANIDFESISPGYSVTCTPAGDYSPRSNVSVAVSVADIATQPNTTNMTWTFTTTSAPPAAPTGFQTAGTDSGYAHLSWNANDEDDLAGYTAYYGTTSGAYTDSLGVGVSTSRSIGGLQSATFYFALRARNDVGQLGGLSIEDTAVVTITRKAGLLPPNGLQLTTPAPGCMTVTWAPNTEPELAGYVVYYGTESVAEGESAVYSNSIDVPRGNAHEVCGLAGDTYYVAVRAYDNQDNFSDYSTEKNLTVTAADVVAPAATLAYPSAGATGTPVNTKVFLFLTDDDSGVDTTSVSVTINGAPPASIVYTGNPQSYGAVCDMGEPLPGGTPIQVDVTVSDFGIPPNTTVESWTFTTGAASDMDPPAFLRHTPGNGEGGVEPGVLVSIEIGDNIAVDAGRVQLFVNGVETEASVDPAGVGRVLVTRTDPSALPPGRVTIHVVVYDLAENRTELIYEFEVQGSQTNVANTDAQGAIVPDGFWADEPDRPLEVRNLPAGWTVRIFNTAGAQVRVFENRTDDGLTWKWDFYNDRGREVARALYLVRVLDSRGRVQTKGKFLVRSTP